MKSEIPNRTTSQIRTHAQKFFIKLAYDAPPNSDIIEYLKTKPANYFLELPNRAASREVDGSHKRPAKESVECPVPHKVFTPRPLFPKEIGSGSLDSGNAYHMQQIR